MRIAVRHGINGNEELATQVVTGVTVGWDLMQQMALRLAFPVSDCPLPEQHGRNPLTGANRQFSDGIPGFRDMLSSAKITIPHCRALPNDNDSCI